MPDNGDFVTIINRTSKALEYQMNGRIYELKPGPNERPFEHVRYAKDQNPLMGSADKFSVQIGSLVGHRWETGGKTEGRDDITPIEQSTSKELLDRQGEDVVEIQTRHVVTRGGANRPPTADEATDAIPAQLAAPPAHAPSPPVDTPSPLKAQLSELLADSKGMNKATLAKRLEELTSA